jgi:probable F420-dependent oxidoreductase
MHIGIFAPLSNPFATPDYVTTLGRGAEERGFHSVWVAEHVVLFDDYTSSYPYSADGKVPAAPGTGTLDIHVALGYLAAVTSRIRLATGICLVPQRNPVYTAKEIATIDQLSGGRVDFGVGVGWLREEFEALGVPFERRGARTREAIEMIKRLWCDELSAYKGEFYELPSCRQFPKPVQSPHPPIYFGGESDAALRRVADFGQGWYPCDIEPTELAARLGELESLLSARGRPREDVKVAVCAYLRPLDLELVKRYRDAGADQITTMVLGPTPEELEARLDTLHRDIVEPARKLQ